MPSKVETSIGSFVIERCEAPGIFLLVEAALDHVAQGVDCGIDGQLDQAVPFGWDHCCAAATFHILANKVSVITLVAEQHFGCRPVSIHDGQIAFEVGEFISFPTPIDASKVRDRLATFAYHDSGAQLFFASQIGPEQNPIVAALIFELSKVEIAQIRAVMPGHLMAIDADLAKCVASGLVHGDAITAATPASAPRDLPPSPMAGMVVSAAPTFAGRNLGCLVADGNDAALVAALKKSAIATGANLKVVAPKVGGAKLSDGA